MTLNNQSHTGDGLRQRFLTLTATCEEMIHLAGKGDWERVSELEARRSRELVEYLSLPMREEDADYLREAIGTISTLNERLVKMATEARDDVAGKLQEIRQGHKANYAYMSSAGGN